MLLKDKSAHDMLMLQQVVPGSALGLRSSQGILSGMQVYWPFHMRLCDTCLTSQTVPQWKLIKDYGLAETLFKPLPNWETIAWNLFIREQLTVSIAGSAHAT